MQGDISRIEAWAKVFDDPAKLVTTITKNVLANWKDVIADIQAANGDISQENYYDAGDEVAGVLVLALGPVPNATVNLNPENLEISQW